MVAVAVACLPIFFTGYSIGRLEAAVFLAYYPAYASYLILASARHDALSRLSVVMLEFALPLTALGLGVSLWRETRKGRAPPGASAP